MLPSNVPDWPKQPGPARRLARAALKPVLALVLIGGLVGLGQEFVGLDQLAKLAASLRASSDLLGGSNPESSNWAGYAATGGSFTAVSGTWRVPEFAPDSPIGTDATWVGIGGVRGTDLIQAGTQETVAGRGRTTYEAWVETLPQCPMAVTDVVLFGPCGDLYSHGTSNAACAISWPVSSSMDLYVGCGTGDHEG